MKIAVINKSKGTGKSTLAKHLLAANLPEARVVEVVGGDDHADVVALKVAHAAGPDQHVILDFDAAAGATLIENLHDVVDLLDGVDLWIVPRGASSMEGQEAVQAFLELSTHIPQERILLISNMAPEGAEGSINVKNLEFAFCPIMSWESLKAGAPDFECQSNIDSVWNQIKKYIASEKLA